MNTIIEKIRAEIINRIDKRHLSEQAKNELVSILSFLSDLEKECEEKPNDQWSEEDEKFFRLLHAGLYAMKVKIGRDDYDKAVERLKSFLLKVKSEKPTNIDFEQELYKHFGQVKDFTLGMQIGKYFYELGKQSKQTEWTEKDEKMFRDAWWHISYSVSNGASTDDDNGITRWLKDIRNRIQQSKPTTAEGLEEEYKDYVESDPVYSKLVNRNAGLSIARHFAQWQKEQMMKGAIDAEFCSAGMFMPMIDFKDKRMEGIKYGDTIKVIVIKEK